MTCTVELFGVARMVAGTREIALTVGPDATIARVFESLAERVPALNGRVIATNGRALVDGYACSVNGLEFVRDVTVRVKDGDRIVLLSADAGG